MIILKMQITAYDKSRARLKMLCLTTLVIASASASADPTADVAQRNAANPFATYSAKALDPLNKGGCYTGSAPSPETLKVNYSTSAPAPSFTFAGSGPLSRCILPRAVSIAMPSGGI